MLEVRVRIWSATYRRLGLGLSPVLINKAAEEMNLLLLKANHPIDGLKSLKLWLAKRTVF